MFTRAAAAKVGARNQDACSLIPRGVQNEVGIEFAGVKKAPIVKEIRAKTGTFDALQKLLGDDLVVSTLIRFSGTHNPVCFRKGSILLSPSWLADENLVNCGYSLCN